MSDTASLDSLPLFTGLHVGTRRRLTANGSMQTYETGATLFVAGSEATGIFVVMSGRVRVVRSHGGRQYVVHTEGPGGTLAEVPFFEEGLLPATAIALEVTRCLILDREALRAIIRDDPAVAWLFLRRLSTRVRELVIRLDRVSTQGVVARLATFVLTRPGSVEAKPFTLGMKQSELAEELGTVREVLVRSLAQLRKSGVIRSAGRGRYLVSNPSALKEIADS